MGLLDEFRHLPSHEKDVIADISKPLKQILFVLQISNDRFQYEYLSAPGIVACLEAAEVAIKESSVISALSRAGNKVNKKEIDGEVKYRIMTHGRRFIQDCATEHGISLVFIQAGTPRTARKNLNELLANFQGEVRICDPYYGIRTLEILENIPKNCTTKFLTCNATDKQVLLTNAIKDFNAEYPNCAIRSLPSGSKIHDRYIHTIKSLIIVGHGLKDIGGKDSFLIELDRSLIADLWNDIKSNFDTKWNIGKTLP